MKNLKKHQVCQVKDLFNDLSGQDITAPVYNVNGHLYIHDGLSFVYEMDLKAPTLEGLIAVLEPSDFLPTLTRLKGEINRSYEQARILRSKISSLNAKAVTQVNRAMRCRGMHDIEDGQGDVFGTRGTYNSKNELTQQLETLLTFIDTQIAVLNNYRYSTHQFLNFVHTPKELPTLNDGIGVS